MSDFIETQRAFVSSIKNPHDTSFRDEEQARRMAIYQSLFFNNVDGFVSSAFPVLKSLYNKERWNALVRAFFSSHHCRSPYFAEISKEFVEFLDDEYKHNNGDPVFASELAHYEWLELDVSIRKPSHDIDYERVLTLDDSLHLSDLASVVSYAYPVHQIQPDFIPQEALAERVYFVVYRDSDDNVEFLQINGLTAFMLSCVENQESITMTELQSQVEQAVPNMDKSVLERGLHQTIIEMAQRFIVLPQ